MNQVHEPLSRAPQYTPTPIPPLETNQIVPMILKHKRLFLGILSGIFAACFCIVLLLPKTYQAEVKFLVKNERKDLVITPDTNSGAATQDAGPTDTEVNSEIELIRSTDVLRPVVLKADLTRRVPGTVNAMGGMPSALSLENAINALRNNLKIQVVKKSDIIDITYVSRDPQVASKVLQNLEDSYLEAHLRIHGVPGSYEFFEQQAGAHQQLLAKSEEQLKAFEEKVSSLVQPDNGASLTEHFMATRASLEDTNAQIAEYGRRVDQDRRLLDIIDARLTTQVRTVPQAQLIGNLNQSLVELQNKRTDLVTKFRPDDRLVTEIDAQITNTQAALQHALTQTSTEKWTDVNPVRQDAEKNLFASKVTLAGLEARRTALNGIMAKYQHDVADAAGARIEHEELLRQVKTNEDNYLLYRRRSEEARIAESLDRERITNVAVVQSPVAPVHPYSPKVLLDLLLAAVLSTLIAGWSVISIERRKTATQILSDQPYRPFAATAASS
jgi:uncharacterized protein involved in exopolysaccharide biosynthesis